MTCVGTDRDYGRTSKACHGYSAGNAVAAAADAIVMTSVTVSYSAFS